MDARVSYSVNLPQGMFFPHLIDCKQPIPNAPLLFHSFHAAIRMPSCSCKRGRVAPPLNCTQETMYQRSYFLSRVPLRHINDGASQTNIVKSSTRAVAAVNANRDAFGVLSPKLFAYCFAPRGFTMGSAWGNDALLGGKHRVSVGLRRYWGSAFL